MTEIPKIKWKNYPTIKYRLFGCYRHLTKLFAHETAGVRLRTFFS